MANRGPLLGVAVLVAVLGVLVVVGGVVGVGPLASTTPADQVKDPREMIARSLQSVLDANAVHLDATVSGTIPGALVGRPEQSVVLDGTTAQADLRPRDARTGASVDSPPLGVALETVTVWDGAWYRTPPDGPWSRASLGSAAADAGVDANPLTLVDRLRAWLAEPDMDPTVTDVPCAGESGTCRHIVLDAGTDPAGLLGALLPDEQRVGPARGDHHDHARRGHRDPAPRPSRARHAQRGRQRGPAGRAGREPVGRSRHRHRGAAVGVLTPAAP